MNESTERELTDAQCDEFRRAPLSFNDMLRAVYRAGTDATTTYDQAIEADGARQVLEVYDKLHTGKVGQHWLWAVIEQIAAGCAGR